MNNCEFPNRVLCKRPNGVAITAVGCVLGLTRSTLRSLKKPNRGLRVALTCSEGLIVCSSTSPGLFNFKPNFNLIGSGYSESAGHMIKGLEGFIGV